VGQNQDGRLEVLVQVYGLGAWPYLSVYHTWQTAPNGNWGGWDALGRSEACAAPAVARNPDGRLDVFAQHMWIGLAHRLASLDGSW
jgi:hypothetical protein